MTEPEETEASEDEASATGQDRETDGRVHFSRLKLMQKSEAHYQANVRKYSASFALGRATHSYLLEDPTKLIVYEGKRDKRVKAYKEFMAAHAGKQIVSPSEMWDIKGMKMAIDRHPLAKRLLQGHRENYMQWNIHGHKAAGTPDVWRSNGDVVELKTDDCTEPESFLRSAERYCYHAQLTWYAAGLLSQRLIDGIGDLSIVAVESSAPYCVTVVELDDDTIQAGIDLWRGWLEKLDTAEAVDHWPGYSAKPVKWSLRR